MSQHEIRHPPEEQGLLDSLPDLVYRYRLRPAPPGFEYVSPSSTAVIGYTPEDHYADPELGLRIVHPDDMPILLDVIERPDPEAVYDGEGVLVAIVGVCRPVPAQHGDRMVSAGDLTIDLATSRAVVAGRKVELTTSELRILDRLISTGREVPRKELVEHLWGSYHAGGERSVEVHVSNLRRKLDPERTGPTRIETVRGVGYRLLPVRR